MNPDELVTLIEHTLGLPPGMLKKAIDELAERKFYELLEKYKSNRYDLR